MASERWDLDGSIATVAYRAAGQIRAVYLLQATCNEFGVIGKLAKSNGEVDEKCANASVLFPWTNVLGIVVHPTWESAKGQREAAMAASGISAAIFVDPPSQDLTDAAQGVH